MLNIYHDLFVICYSTEVNRKKTMIELRNVYSSFPAKLIFSVLMLWTSR